MSGYRQRHTLLIAGFIAFVFVCGTVASPDAHPTPRDDTTSGDDVSHEEVVLLRDEVGLFDAALHSEVRFELRRLRRDTRVDLFVATKATDDLAETESIADELFASLVREVGHYKVILIFVVVDHSLGQGLVSTNLGAGVYHLVEAQSVAELFATTDEGFSPLVLKQGVSYLARTIRQSVDERRRADIAAGTVEEDRTESGFGGWTTIIAVLAVLLSGVVGWMIVRRQSICPRCGSELRTRVSIVVGARGAELAQKTFKCFSCGYTRRRALLPSVFVGRTRPKTRAQGGA